MQHIKYEFNNLLFQYIFKYYQRCFYVTKTPNVNKINSNFCASFLHLQQLNLCFGSNIPSSVGLKSQITFIETFICLCLSLFLSISSSFYYKLGLSVKPNTTLSLPGYIIHFSSSTLFTMRSNYVTRSFDMTSTLLKRKYSTNKNHFASYLAGLIEGDGSIAVHDPNGKSKEYRPKFIIVFKRSDLPLANHLCKLTGCGKVYDKPNRGYVL